MVKCLITNNIFKIHSSFFFVAVSCIITGLFREFIIFSSIILVHELGHYICAKVGGLKVIKIVLYPFGGVSYLNEVLDIPLYKEMFSLLGGILFQTLFYMLIYIFYNLNIIDTSYYLLFTNYHYSILFFNLLPIYPLDGIKILNVLINKYFSFKLTHYYTIIISVVTILIVLLVIKSSLMFSYYLIIMVLIYNIYLEITNHKYLTNRFILEKKIYPNNYHEYKFMDNNKIFNMMRNKKHYFKDGDIYLTEKQKLKKHFNLFDNSYKK